MTTARLSDLSLKGEVRRSPQQSAWQAIARGGNFVRCASSWRALGCEETTVLCFLPSWSTFLLERGLGGEGRFEVASRSETPKTSCQNHKQQLLRPCSGPSKAAHVNPEYFVRTQFSYPGLGSPTFRTHEIFVQSLTDADSLTCFVPFTCNFFRTEAAAYEIYENIMHTKYSGFTVPVQPG